MNILYIGSINANQKGAIGSHTMGIIQAFKECENLKLDGLFFKDKIPEIKPEFSYIFNEKISNRAVNKILQCPATPAGPGPAQCRAPGAGRACRALAGSADAGDPERR